MSRVTELMAGRAKKGGCFQDLWFLQNKKNVSKTEKEEMILADTVRVSSEVTGQVRERQDCQQVAWFVLVSNPEVNGVG